MMRAPGISGRIATVWIIAIPGALAAAAVAARAAETDLIHASATRSVAGVGVEQTAVSIEGGTAKWISNSNFMAAPSSRAKIGVYSAPLNEELTLTGDELRLVRDRLTRSAGTARELTSALAPGAAEALSTARRPHSIGWNVGGQDLPSGSMHVARASRALSGLPEAANWKAEDAVEAELLRDGRVMLRFSRPDRGPERLLRIGQGCESLGKVVLPGKEKREKIRCQAAPLGTVYLYR